MNAMSGILFGVLVACLGVVYADEPWLGKWESIEGKQDIGKFKEFVKAVIGRDLNDQQAQAKVIHEIIKSGDHYEHKISVPVKNYQNNFQFKMNEEGKHSVNGKEFKYKYHSEGNKLMGVVNLGNQTIHEVSEVKGDELEKSYSVGDIHAKRQFKKQAN